MDKNKELGLTYLQMDRNIKVINFKSHTRRMERRHNEWKGNFCLLKWR
jgi:hypothetical protein